MSYSPIPADTTSAPTRLQAATAELADLSAKYARVLLKRDTAVTNCQALAALLPPNALSPGIQLTVRSVPATRASFSVASALAEIQAFSD